MCNAHLLRELIFFAEEEQALWARNMAATLTAARQMVQEAQQRGEDALDPIMLYNLQSMESIKKCGAFTLPALVLPSQSSSSDTIEENRLLVLR